MQHSTSFKERQKATIASINAKQAEDEEKYNYLMTKNGRSPGPKYDHVNEEALSLLRKFPEHSFGKANRSGFFDRFDSPGPKYDQDNVLVSSMHAKPPTVTISHAQRQTGMIAGQFYNNVGFHDTNNYEKLSSKPQSPQRQFSRAPRLGTYISRTPGAKIHRYDITSDHRSTPACSFSRSPRGDLDVSAGVGGVGGSGGGIRRAYTGRRGSGGGGGGGGSAGDGNGGNNTNNDSSRGEPRSRSSGSSLRKKHGFADINYTTVMRTNPQVSFAHAERMPPVFADSPGPAAHGNTYNPAKPTSSIGTWSKEARLGAAWLL